MTIADLKAALPLPELMARMGYADAATDSSKCPWHDDRTPSFGIFQRKGAWYWKCQAGCGHGDELDFIEKALNLQNGEAIARYKELSGGETVGSTRRIAVKPCAVSVTEAGTQSEPTSYSNKPPAQLSPLTDAEVQKLATWRGYSLEFARELSDNGTIGTHKGQIAFPVSGGVHFRKKDGSWRYSKGAKAELFVLGDTEEGAPIHCHESQWDALAYADASGERSNIVATRGAANAKLIADRLKGHTGTLYLWQQNDAPGAKWARDIRELLTDQQIKLVLFAGSKHKDLSEWRTAGATEGDVFNAVLDAKDFPVEALQASSSHKADQAAATLSEPETNFPVPVLAEPLQASDVEPGNTTHTRSGEARESNRPTTPDTNASGDSRGGEKLSVAPPAEPQATAEEQASPAEIRTEASPPSSIVGLAKILDDCVAFLEKYLRFPEGWHSKACALWVVHTWVFSAFSRTPYLHICSPEANCGKTLLMNCLYHLAPGEPRRWSVVSPSEASLFRKIDRDKPVIFLDEVDHYFARGYDDPVVAILNSGYKVGANVPRCLGNKGELEEFKVYSPKCFTGIGALPHTTSSRSIHIHMARQDSSDRAPMFRDHHAVKEVADIRAFLADWSLKAFDALSSATPDMPQEITDGRQVEIIEPLLAIADMAGGSWTQDARDAVVSAFEQPVEDSDATKLLRSVRVAFLTLNEERILSERLVKFLVEMTEADTPWPTWWERDVSNGRWHAAARKVATMLKGFRIQPRNVRVQVDNHEEQGKGYMKADFEHAWRRYIPSEVKRVQNELEL